MPSKRRSQGTDRGCRAHISWTQGSQGPRRSNLVTAKGQHVGAGDHFSARPAPGSSKRQSLTHAQHGCPYDPAVTQIGQRAICVAEVVL